MVNIRDSLAALTMHHLKQSRIRPSIEWSALLCIHRKGLPQALHKSAMVSTHVYVCVYSSVVITLRNLLTTATLGKRQLPHN